MKKISLIIFIMFMFLGISCSYATVNPSNAQISKMENSIWGFEYTKDDIHKRVSRIENNVFGKSFTNLTLEKRIKKLNEAMGLESYEDSKKPVYELEMAEEEGINYPQIDSLEYQMFNKTYEKENIYKRLSRLETKIFGSPQEGALSIRTDKLKTYLRPEKVAQNPNYHVERPYSQTRDIEQYMGSQSRYDDSDVFIQLAGLETVLFGKTYSQDPVGLRLNRLERKIFQRDFSSDDDSLRIQRLQAASSAQRTARMYEANKVQKYTSTGLQLGSILLMILAIIL